MKKQYLIFFFLFLSGLALARQGDSLNFNLRADTLLQTSIEKADSIARSFQSKADSLNALWRNQILKIDSSSNRLQSKIDSLSNLKLPAEKLTGKLDSLSRVKVAQMNSLTQKLNDLKNSSTQGLMEIQLPPQMQESMQKLQSSIADYSIPSLNTFASGMSLPDLPDAGATPLLSLSSHLHADTGFGTIMETADKAGQFTNDAQNLVKGNINELKNIDKTMEGTLAGMEGMDQLREGSALAETYRMDSAAMADKAKEIVKEQVMAMAEDHFAGKQELLQEAMNKMSKLKRKYASVQSVAELPARLPNPLKGKPLIDRLVPALSLQIQKSNYFMVDVNPLLLYRISPRLSAGAGWNYRLPFDNFTFKNEAVIYGPRAAVEFKWTRGLNFRLLPEIMNTTIPAPVALANGVDPAYREWVGSLFFGVKKDFKVHKQIKGYTEVLYNLYDPDDLSPYGDELSVRFGFEFGMEKNKKRIDN